ncbi:MarR family winged helix-turn-helix transcriptional regulator [Spirochaetota bacterium]
MDKNKDMGKIREIEQYMLEFSNIISNISKKMKKTSVGIMGFPINLSQLKAMSAFDEEGQFTMGELCKVANVKMPSMTEMIDKLENEGFLARARDTKDRRVVRVQMTEKGRKVHKKILGRRSNELVSMYGELSTKDQNELTRSLKKALEILNKVI